MNPEGFKAMLRGSRLLCFIVVAGVAMSGAGVAPSLANECRVFTSVNREIAKCAREVRQNEFEMSVEIKDEDSGTVTTDILIGKVVMSYALDPETETIKYCILGKPWIVTAGQIFWGIEDTFRRCR